MKRFLYLCVVVPLLLVLVGSSLAGVLSSVLPRPAYADAPPSSITIGPWNNITFSFQDRAHIVGDFGSAGQVTFVDVNVNDTNRQYVAKSNLFCDGNKASVYLKSGSDTTIDWSSGTIYAYEVQASYNDGLKGCKDVDRSAAGGVVTISNPTDPDTGGPAAGALLQWDGSNITTLSGESGKATFFPITPPGGAPGFYAEKDDATDCGAYAAVQLDSGSTSKGTIYFFHNGASLSVPGFDDLPDDATTAPVTNYPSIANYVAHPNKCKVITNSGFFGPHTVTITGKQGVAAPGSTSSTDDSSDDGGDGTLGCDVQGLSVFGSNSFFNPTNDVKTVLDWLICGAVQILSNIAGWLDNQITGVLSLGDSNGGDQPNEIFGDSSGCSGTCASYYGAWSSFRDIALGLLAVAGLIMVVSQALGMELLDAYTIRKVLPRLLIAAIGITLSWPLMRFLVTLSNDLGYGVPHLIAAPFKTNHVIATKGITLNFGEAMGVGIAAFVGVAVAGLGGILLLLASAVLAMLVAFGVMILRQIVVIIFIILAPIAIVAYILPNTQRLYKFWWDNLLKTLMMFPMITALITAGYVFSWTTMQNGGPSNIVDDVIAFVAYFAPYFMIPMTFRAAGSIMGGVGNMVTSRAQGGFQMLRKKRGEIYGANLKKVRAGQRWDHNFGRFRIPFTSKDTSIGKIASRFAVNALDQDELIPYRLGKKREGRGPLKGMTFGGVPGFKKGAAAVEDKLGNRAINESVKGVQEIDQAGGMHYEAWRGVAGDFNNFEGTGIDEHGNQRLIKEMLTEKFVDEKTGKVKAPASLKEFETMAEILQTSDNDKERLGGIDLAQHAGTLATIKSHPDMEYADAQIMGAIGLSAAGRAEPQALADITNSIQGRLGAGPAQRALKTAERVTTRNRPDLRDGHGIIYNANTGQYTSAYSDENYRSATAVGSVLSVKGTDWSGAKAEAVKAAHRTIAWIASGNTGNIEDQRVMQDAIRQGLQNPYNDAGQKKAWAAVARDSGWTDEQLAALSGRAPSLGDQQVMDPGDQPDNPLGPAAGPPPAN